MKLKDLDKQAQENEAYQSSSLETEMIESKITIDDDQSVGDGFAERFDVITNYNPQTKHDRELGKSRILSQTGNEDL